MGVMEIKVPVVASTFTLFRELTWILGICFFSFTYALRSWPYAGHERRNE